MEYRLPPNYIGGGRLSNLFYELYQPLLPKTPSLFSEELKELVDKLTKKKPGVNGYHLMNIERGKFGEFSKIREEFHECEDALKQNNVPMLFVELSDMFLAIDGFLKKHHPTVTLDHLLTHARATERAFESGERHAK
jgi:hypothetical protein